MYDSLFTYLPKNVFGCYHLNEEVRWMPKASFTLTLWFYLLLFTSQYNFTSSQRSKQRQICKDKEQNGNSLWKNKEQNHKVKKKWEKNYYCTSNQGQQKKNLIVTTVVVQIVCVWPCRYSIRSSFCVVRGKKCLSLEVEIQQLFVPLLDCLAAGG